MGVKENEEQRELLLARIDDIKRAAEKGDVGITAFLSPREQRLSEEYLKSRGATFASYGGYSEAERKRIYVLPDYMATEVEDLEELLSSYGYSSRIRPLKISGSGYKKLSHRQYLGSILALGLQRDVVGDILLLDEDGREAILLCDETIKDFLLSELDRIGGDKVRVSELEPKGWEAPKRKTVPVKDTVASPRVDAVVAALCDLSREKARYAVESGLVELDYESEERPDRMLTAPVTVSVRGYGKFLILSLSDKTRKGRYRLEASKYV